MLARLRKTHEENEGGFTLIELLVVVIIIGILAAIAIPTFLNQREKAWQKAAQSDLRNAATVLEEHFSDSGTFAADAATAATGDDLLVTDIKVSDGVAMEVFAMLDVAATPESEAGYCMAADHTKLGGAADTIDYLFIMVDGKPFKTETGLATCAALATDRGTAAPVSQLVIPAA